jgi:hypothetical protein
MLEAVSAAVDEHTVPLTPPEEINPPDDELEQDDPPAGDPPSETAEEKTAREAAEAAAAAETDEEKTAREAAEAAAAAAETPEAKATREAAEAAAAAAKAKPADPVNDPIPSTVSTRTRERITALVKEVKDRDARIEENTRLFQEIANTGVSPDNFAQTLTVLRLFNSPNLDDKRQAFKFLQAQVAELAGIVGEVLPGADPLEGHDDLKQALESQSITREHAVELAQSRARAAAIEAAGTRSTQTQEQQAAQLRQAGDVARAALNSVGAALKAYDEDTYNRIAPVVIAKLKPVFATLHPSQWVEKFNKEYADAVKSARNIPATPRPNGDTPAGQPMRANRQPAGGGQKQPTSMLEAMELGLSKHAGR